MRLWFKLSLASMFFLLSASTVSGDKDKPNVLLIICDQMVPFLTGTYGHEVVRTPNLDQLADGGVLFKAAYSPNPICAPARASLITGKYSSQIGVYDNAAELPAGEPTIAHYFSYAGYETVLSGKMHFVGPDQWHGFEKRYLPNIYPTGFEWAKERFNKKPRSHGRSYLGESIRIIPEGTDLIRDENGKLRVRSAYPVDLEDPAGVQSGFNESSRLSAFDRSAHTMALEYIRNYGSDRTNEGSRPFLLCVSYNYPHEPFFPPEELWNLYEDKDIEIEEWPDDLKDYLSPMDQWLNRHHGLETYDISDRESLRRVRRAYYALVTFVDMMVGELLEQLADAGLEKNTIVIFTSDHGDMLGKRGMVQKRCFYEWSSRVPLIFRFPDGSHAGTVITEAVNLIDVLPTLLELTGIEHEAAEFVDGESLVPYMDGRLKRQSPVFSEMPGEGVFAPCFMVRKGKMKYNYFHGYGAQLFNLEQDPGEWNDLSGNIDYVRIEYEMRNLIMERFDPVEIERRVTESHPGRLLIRDVMEKQSLNWDYHPQNSKDRSIR